MYHAEYNVRHEQFKDLQRYAENERLARQINDYKQSPLTNAQRSIGKGLVNIGQYLLNER
ncbi:MAG: hypothetical protein WBC91_07325 [Phototrophicaceae bacterium]